MPNFFSKQIYFISTELEMALNLHIFYYSRYAEPADMQDFFLTSNHNDCCQSHLTFIKEFR